MKRHRLDRRYTATAGLVAMASVLVPAGLYLDSWWPIAAGTAAATAAAWRATERS